MGVPVILVAGESGSGKTTVVEALVACMKERGLRVATAKHVHHEIESLDVPGKDSWRHRRAGSVATLVLSRNEAALFADPGLLGTSVKRVLEFLMKVANPDVIIVEGFSRLADEVGADVAVITAKSEAGLRKTLKDVEGEPVLAGLVWSGEGGHPPVWPGPIYTPGEGLRKLCERLLEELMRKKRSEATGET